MGYFAIDNRSPDLKHYGVLGMKWGIRRYENPDGTLTPAGKARYGKRYKRYLKQYRSSNTLDGETRYIKNIYPQPPGFGPDITMYTKNGSPISIDQLRIAKKLEKRSVNWAGNVRGPKKANKAVYDYAKKITGKKQWIYFNGADRISNHGAILRYVDAEGRNYSIDYSPIRNIYGEVKYDGDSPVMKFNKYTGKMEEPPKRYTYKELDKISKSNQKEVDNRSVKFYMETFGMSEKEARNAVRGDKARMTRRELS